MQADFLKYRKFYLFFIALIGLASIAVLLIFGLRPGIDFTGGSILEIEYQQNRPSNQEVQDRLAGLDLGSLIIQPAGEKGMIIRMKDIDEQMHREVIQKLGTDLIKELRFESVGSVVGKELGQKTVTLVLMSLFAIVFYIALAFRKVQRPISSWKYALSSLASLSYDVLVTLGVFSVLGKFYHVEISIPVIAALLTVIGSSINNVVVVFDRIRENIIRRSSVTFQETVNKSLNETIGRCLNTSIAYLLPLFAIFFWGGDTLRYFSLALIIGIIVGTISSIFLASSALVGWLDWKRG